MNGHNDKRNDMTQWADDRNASLAQTHKHLVHNDGSNGVAGKWGHENQGDDRSRQLIILTELLDVSVLLMVRP